MHAKWGLVVAALFCAGCDDPKPTGPSAGRDTRITVIAPHPTIAVGGSTRVDLLVDLLNALNDTAEEALATDNLFSPNFAHPTVFMDPRRAMLSVRLNLGR